jgi:hypothetical protein
MGLLLMNPSGDDLQEREVITAYCGS